MGIVSNLNMVTKTVSFRMTDKPINHGWSRRVLPRPLTPFSIHEPKMYAQKIYIRCETGHLNKKQAAFSSFWFLGATFSCHCGSEWLRWLQLVAGLSWSQSEFGRARSKHGKHGLKSPNKTALMKTKKSELSEFGSARQLGLNWKMELCHDYPLVN